MSDMNLQQMLRILLAKGFKQYQISDKTGVNTATISRTLKGKFTPNYKNGKAIEDFYREEIVENQKAS